MTEVGVIGSEHRSGLPLRDGRIHCLSVAQETVKTLASVFVASLLLLARVAAMPAPLSAQSVVILANSDEPDSVPIAEHYADVRGVPRANIIAMRMPLGETVTWREFIDQIWQPFQDELVSRKWILSDKTNVTDELGRRKYIIFGHRIDAIVVCRGVPLRISHDAGLYKDFPPYTQNPQFRTNAGAVDSELGLLCLTNYPINAFVPNPLYHRDRPTELDRGRVVMVSRLDGPTASDALGLVDLAVQAEKTGLIGRGYADIGGPVAKGDVWLRSAADQMKALGFDESVDTAGATMPESARFDAPVLYFGWYNPDLNGPFGLPGFRFPPGAVALHIHSFSGYTLRSSTKGWVGPLVGLGVTATVGNVYEPYLEFTHRPDYLLEALAKGKTLVEAAYYAMPVLSWEGIVIGDPLYRPFTVDLAAQESHLADYPGDAGDYIVLRRANLLISSGKPDEALTLLRARLKVHYGLALGLSASRLLSAKGDKPGAASLIWFATGTTEFASSEWEVAHEIAVQLAACNEPAAAVTVYTHLLDNADIDRRLKLPWLADARQAAAAAHDDRASRAFKLEIDRLVGQVLGEK